MRGRSRFTGGGSRLRRGTPRAPLYGLRLPLRGQYDEARSVIDAGLKLAPEEATLIELLGDVRSHIGESHAALADWCRAHELEPENLSSIYSSAFLLELEGRLEEAIEACRFILDWCQSRGYELDTEWPKRALERLGGATSARA